MLTSISIEALRACFLGHFLLSCPFDPSAHSVVNSCVLPVLADREGRAGLKEYDREAHPRPDENSFHSVDEPARRVYHGSVLEAKREMPV